ncbi:MAG: pilus assembly protein N-terminal domain-containing protein [Proteobacteria bacterium]|nr:pilus assembly protein N-terminal domain-containing protein [Pseudomonadota bacterium]
MSQRVTRRVAWTLVALWIATVATSANAQSLQRQAITRGTHSRLVVETDVQRVALGDGQILDVELINNREVLVLGKQVGQSSVTLWFADGAVRQILVLVQRDLSVLQAALRDIFPTLAVESAPDRDAVVLRGEVPDVSYSQAAEAAARSYLEAGRRGRQAAQGPLLPAAGASDSAEPQDPDAGGESLGILRPGGVGREARAAVINLIRVRELPAQLEQRLERAVRKVGGEHLRVRRLVRGDLPSDADSFVLEGRVATQTVLTRTLSVAARILGGTGEELGRSVRVLGNEGGGLASRRTGEGSGSAESLPGFGSSAASFQIRAGDLGNRLGENVARATALELLDGRLLSFVSVDDLPQVRVNVRLYEVNRTLLGAWSADVQAVAGNVDLGGGSGVDFQNVLTLLSGGTVNEFTISGAKWAIDTVFSLLEEKGIARSLANPTVMVLSGEVATVSVGGELPIPTSVVTSAGNQVFESVFFVPFGVQLGIRPLVGPGDVITLDLRPQVIQPDPNLTAAVRQSTGSDQTTTAFESRSVKTTARLADGQVLAIGGLISRQLSDARAYTPWLHRVPLLGWLWKSYDENDEDLELVVVVSPTILREREPRVAMWSFRNDLELLAAAAAGPLEIPPVDIPPVTRLEFQDENPAAGAATARDCDDGLWVGEECLPTK